MLTGSQLSLAHNECSVTLKLIDTHMYGAQKCSDFGYYLLFLQ